SRVTFAFGYLSGGEPGREAFAAAYASAAGREKLHEKVTLLHCTSEYPAPVSQVNLSAMLTLRQAFNLPVGYSDHTLGPVASIAAVALGAAVIEKHLTLDHTRPGPDHQASTEPEEFRQLVLAIRQVEALRGDGAKVPSLSELEARRLARKSLVAKGNIGKGETFTVENLTSKRPAGGKSPMQYWDVLNTKAEKKYLPDDPI
ncbi:MAG TPA: N-acetylneuraminate synthase family protein, partial [Candidatus Glassbacteria bacterium]|nr:N-acetylneuraminate synthase family protein [Candidatus Glassbacteria bacterium]